MKWPSPACIRFLTGFTFPLFLLALAWRAGCISFEQYPAHLKYERRILLTRLTTWQRAVKLLHNGLLAAAYLFLAALPVLGIALRAHLAGAAGGPAAGRWQACWNAAEHCRGRQTALERPEHRRHFRLWPDRLSHHHHFLAALNIIRPPSALC